MVAVIAFTFMFLSSLGIVLYREFYGLAFLEIFMFLFGWVSVSPVSSFWVIRYVTQIHDTYRPPANHLLTTYRPPTDHLPTTYQPLTNHLLTTHQPPTDHLLTTYWPPSNNLLTTYWPPTNHFFTVQLVHNYPEQSHFLSKVNLTKPRRAGGRQAGRQAGRR